MENMKKIKIKENIEVPRPMECYACYRYVSQFGISCPYLEKEVLCPKVEAITLLRTDAIMHSVLEQLNVIKKGNTERLLAKLYQLMQVPEK